MGSLTHFISLNSQGLRNKDKRYRLKEYLKLQKVDIAFLQETHFTSDLVSSINSEFDQWNTFHSFGSSTSRGCSIFINKKLCFNADDTLSDPTGRYLLINVTEPAQILLKLKIN